MNPELLDPILLSLRVAGLSTLISLPCGFILARVLTRPWPGRDVLSAIINLPLVLPPLVTGYMLLLLLGRRGPIGGWLYHSFGIDVAFTVKGAVVAAAVVAFPLLVRSIRLSMEAIDPRLPAAARSLGAGPLDTLLTVIAPLSFKGIVAGCLIHFSRGLGEFGATIILVGSIQGRTETLPLAIYRFLSLPGGESQAAVLVWAAVALSVASTLIAERLKVRA